MQFSGFISKDGDTAALQTLDEAVQQVIFAGTNNAADAVIVVTQAGVNAVFAFDCADEFDDLISEFAVNIMGHIVAGEDDDVNVEQVDAVDAIPEVFYADGSAAMQVADMYHSPAAK